MAVNVTSTLPLVQFPGDGATTAFTVPFLWYADGDLVVYKGAGSTVPLALGSDYTLTGAGSATGGTITFTTPPAGGVVCTVLRQSVVQRTSQYPLTGRFPTDTLNTDLGKVTTWIQELQTRLSRTFRLADSDTLASAVLPATRANTLAGFDGAGQLTTYPLSPGAVSDMSTSLAAIASGSLRTLAAHFGDFPMLTDVGGVDPTGVNDSTAGVRAAAATGKSYWVPPGTYKLTGGVTLAGNGQRFVGAGPYLATFLPSGNFDVFTFSGGNQGGGLEAIAIDCTGMTGGNAIAVNAYHRSLFRDLLIFNPWNVASVTHQNVTAFETVWCNNIRGSYGISWAGNDSARGDLLRLVNVTLGCNATARPTGLIVDGYQNTVEAVSLDIVTPGVGIDIRNTLGGTNVPLFFHGWNVEVDFPSLEALKIQAGSEHHFTDSYFQGSVGADGILIGSAASIVTIKGTQITGHNKNGVNISGQNVALTACRINGNSQAGVGSYDGIVLQSTVQGFTMVGGSCGGSTQRYGVNMTAGAIRIAIAAVDLIGNATKAFIDSTAGGNDNVSVTGCAGCLTSILDGIKITTDGVPPLLQAYFAGGPNATLTIDGQGTGGVCVAQGGSALGFFGHTPAVKQTVTGAKGGNAALGSLLTILAGYGLLTDSSTA
jgi:hypothetical protein